MADLDIEDLIDRLEQLIIDGDAREVVNYLERVAVQGIDIQDLLRRAELRARARNPNIDEGAGQTIIDVKLKKGELGKYGYRLGASLKNRKLALDQAIGEYGPLSVLRKIVILRTFNKNNEKNYAKLDKDVRYIQRHYFDGVKDIKDTEHFDMKYGGKVKTTKKRVTPKVPEPSTESSFDPTPAFLVEDRFPDIPNYLMLRPPPIKPQGKVKGVDSVVATPLKRHRRK